MENTNEKIKSRINTINKWLMRLMFLFVVLLIFEWFWGDCDGCGHFKYGIIEFFTKKGDIYNNGPVFNTQNKTFEFINGIEATIFIINFSSIVVLLYIKDKLRKKHNITGPDELDNKISRIFPAKKNK